MPSFIKNNKILFTKPFNSKLPRLLILNGESQPPKNKIVVTGCAAQINPEKYSVYTKINEIFIKSLDIIENCNESCKNKSLGHR